MDIIGKKYLYFAISLLIIVPGLFSLLRWGLDLSIDFTGGSEITVSSPSGLSENQTNQLKQSLADQKIKVETVQGNGKTYTFRTSTMTQAQDNNFIKDLSKIKGAKQEEFTTIGPTIGEETTTNAFKAVALASLLIVVYISIVFRKVPKPASPIRFGVSAIAALLHDVLVVVGVFSLLGHFHHVEVDSLFVTAVLTIIGFSVHDTIVVFDRIRENLGRKGGADFAKTVNDSILQTMSRSLNTSITVLLVLLALLLFGGSTIRWFVVALLVGVASGTYSSIFNAAPLLVVWHEWSQKRSKK